MSAWKCDEPLSGKPHFIFKVLNKNPSKEKHTMERLHILTQLRKCNHCADAIAQAFNLSGFGHFGSRPFSTAALNKDTLGSRPFSTSNVFLQFQIHRFRYVELVSNATGCSALFLEMWRSMTKCHKCEPSTQAVQHCVSQSNSGSRP